MYTESEAIKIKVKEKEPENIRLAILTLVMFFRDEYGTICMKIDDYDAKIHGDTGKLYELNAVSLKNAELRFYQTGSNAYPVKGLFVEE